MLSLFLHELQVRRGSIMGWAVGLSVYAGLYTAFYPALPEEMLTLDYANIELFQAFGRITMTSFEGYLASSIFNFLGVLLGVFAVTTGVGILAGEEERGTLEALVTLPIARWRLLLAKALALATASLLILAAVGLVVATVFVQIDSEVDTLLTPAGLFAMTLEIWPLVLVLSMLSLFLGALLPTARWASASAAAFLVTAYFGNNLAAMIAVLQPLRRFSPFFYFDPGPSAAGGNIDWSASLLLLLVAVVLLVLAMIAFSFRDITTGRWAAAGLRRFKFGH